MNYAGKIIVATVLVLSGSGTVSEIADARSLGGYTGLPNNPSQFSCFHESNGSVTNTGSGSACASAIWEVMLPVDSGNTNYTPTYWVEDDPAFTGNWQITCIAGGFNQQDTEVWWSNTAWQGPPSPGSGASQGITLGQTWVPDGGFLLAACSMGEGSTWFSTNY